MGYQSDLDQHRSQSGNGMGDIRDSYDRSSDQYYANSGNPMTVLTKLQLPFIIPIIKIPASDVIVRLLLMQMASGMTKADTATIFLLPMADMACKVHIHSIEDSKAYRRVVIIHLLSFSNS